MKIISEAKLPFNQKSSMAQRVTRHLRLLRQLKCLTASKTPTVLDYPRNFANAAKDGLKGTTRWAVYYFTNPNSWYPLLETGNNGGNSWNSPFVPLSERNLARRTGQPRTLWLRGAARKQQKTRRIGRWNIIVRFPVWWWLHGDIPSLEREADFYLGRWKSASKEVFASTAV